MLKLKLIVSPKMSLKFKLNVNTVLTFTDNAKDNIIDNIIEILEIFSCCIGWDKNECPQ